MRKGMVKCLALAVMGACLASFAAAQQPQPQQKPVWTRITLTELHCAGCVKKLVTQVSKVPGVAGAQGDLPKAAIYVQHKPGVNPSPKQMWEAMEKGDHTPTLLEGPSGTFKSKPTS